MDIPFDDVKRLLEEQIPFNRFLGIRVLELREGFAAVELPYRPEFVGDPYRPALHGGVLSTLLDFCGGAAVWTTCGLAGRVSTIDLRVDYLKPGALEAVGAEAKVVRAGNRVAVIDAIAFQRGAREHPIATGKAVYNVKRRDAAR